MSASDNLGRQNLPDQAPAGVLNSDVLHNDVLYEPLESLRARRIEAAKESGLYESIKQEGVRSPVLMYPPTETEPPTVMNGHHRVFAAADIDPNISVPLKWVWQGEEWAAKRGVRGDWTP